MSYTEEDQQIERDARDLQQSHKWDARTHRWVEKSKFSRACGVGERALLVLVYLGLLLFLPVVLLVWAVQSCH